jgi:DNA-binding response OmpR family regulator
MGEGIVLVIEDDETIGAGLRTALEAEDYRVTWCPTGAGGIDAAGRAVHDLVLLDLGLPDLDGVEVCRQLRREHPALTIVVLTARADEASVVGALDAGADDYLIKPFRVAELLARIRAHRRRPVGVRVEVGEVIALGGLHIDTGSRRAWSNGTELYLRAKEYDLLCLLARSAGQVLTRERIMCTVWDTNHHGSTKTLDMHVSALRRKLGHDHPVTITTLRGVGYRMEAP